jgi:hypothetical protein
MAGKATPTDPATYSRVKAQVKAQVKRWPSAYASGMVVQKYKAAMAKKGKKPYTSSSTPKGKTSLSRWYKEKWVNVTTGTPCGSAKTKQHYPVCRPSKIVSKKHTPRATSELTKKQREKMIKLKQKAKKRVVRYDKLI